MEPEYNYFRPSCLAGTGRQFQLWFSEMKSYRIRFTVAIFLMEIFLLTGCSDIFVKNINDSVIDNLAPSLGWTTYNPKVNFSWSSVEGATSYSFQLASPSFNSQHELVIDSVLVNNKLTLTLKEGTYEWRVRGINSAYFTGYSTGSVTVLHEIDISQQKINLLQPTTDQLLLQSFVNFSWDQIEGAQYYVLRIKKGSWNNINLLEQRVYKNSYATNLDDGNYTWGVSCVDTIRHKNSDFAIGTFTVNKDAPLQTKLIAPANKDTLKINYIQFNWSKPENALNYNLEVYSDALLTSLVQTRQTTDTTAILNISSNGQYFWRVKEIDPRNNTSSYSSVSTFCIQVKTIVNLTDKVLVLSSPGSNSYLTISHTTFWWEEVSGTDKYQLQVVSPDFSHSQSLVVNESLTGTTFSADLPSGSYQWRVKAINSTSSTSYFTGSFTIYKSDITSQLVSLITPVDGSSLNLATVSFQWNPIAGADYQFVLKKGSWDTGTEIQRKKISSTSIDFALTDGDYTWGVKAIDKIDGSETNFSVRSFSVDRVPPLIPTLVLPENNSIINSGQVSFQWKATDQTDKDLSYTLDVYKQSGATSVLVIHQILSGTQYNFNYSGSGTYFWQVSAKDKAGNISDFSNLNMVNLNGNSLTDKVVTLKAPYSGFESSVSEVTFWWDAVPGADSYQFQLVKPNFNQPEVLMKDVSVISNQITIQLSSGTYQWHVKAINSTSESKYSDIFTLVIK